MDTNTSKEARKRIHIANKTYDGLLQHLRSDNITRKTKYIYMLIYKTFKRPIRTYGLEKKERETISYFPILRDIYRGVK